MIIHVLLAVLIVLCAWGRWRAARYAPLHGKIGSSSLALPFLGHSLMFLGDSEDRISTIRQLSEQAYRNAYGMVSLWVGTFFCVAISDPEPAHFILKSCLDKGPMIFAFRHFVANGSIFAPESIWRVRRKINAAVLAPRHVNRFVSTFERNGREMVDRLTEVAGRGDVSMWGYLCLSTFQNSCETTLGDVVNLNREEFMPFCEAFMSYLDTVVTRLTRPWLYSIQVYKLLPEAARQSLNKKIVWDYINNLIILNKDLLARKQRALTENNNYALDDDKKSILELLIKYSKGYSDEELREEILVLLLASIDTTASVGGFTAVLLSQHPDVQEKVYEEINLVFEDSSRPITVDDLNKLKYLDAVVRETMRICPPVPLIMRKCQKDIELPSGLVFKEGTQVLVNIFGMHHNPKYWGADAHKFRPERFLDATPEQLSAFLPFSSGPRNCAGYRTGMMSVKTTLICMLRRFRLKPAESFAYNELSPLRLKHALVTKHVDKFQLQLEQRP